MHINGTGVVVNVVMMMGNDFRFHSSLSTVLQGYIRRFPIPFECCMVIFNKAPTILANFFCHVQLKQAVISKM